MPLLRYDDIHTLARWMGDNVGVESWCVGREFDAEVGAIFRRDRLDYLVCVAFFVGIGRKEAGGDAAVC